MDHLKQAFFTIIGTIAGSFFTLFIVVKIYGGDIRSLVPTSPHLLSSNTDLDKLSNIDKLKLEHLIDKNIIFSADDLLGQIGTFYSTIIVFLVAIITVMSIFTLFFVKASAEEKAEEKAKDVAKQAIDDKIDPKIQAIDERLLNFKDEALDKKIEFLLQCRVLESIHFWDKINNSIYRKSEESLEDYDIASIQGSIRQHSGDIANISSTVQKINSTLERLNNPHDENEVISMDET